MLVSSICPKKTLFCNIFVVCTSKQLNDKPTSEFAKIMCEKVILVFETFFCFAALVGRVAVAEDVHWNYYGTYGEDNWGIYYNACDASTHVRQSPINIVQKDVKYDPSLTTISLVVFGPNNDNITITNNGHTVNFNYDSSAIRIQGGNLNGSFRVGGIHFHWGSNDSIGSEHRIDNSQSLMEMHIVAYDESRFSGILNATGAVNSIAVLGVLFTLSSDDNQAFAQLISNFQSVRVEGNIVKMPSFPLSALLPSNTSAYFRYLGSLTTPPCAESVVWTIFKTTQTISEKQLSEFRQLQEMVEKDNVTVDYLSDNWRVPEPLDGRIITSSFQYTYMDKPSSKTLPSCMPSVASLVAALVLALFSVAVASIA